MQGPPPSPPPPQIIFNRPMSVQGFIQVLLNTVSTPLTLSRGGNIRHRVLEEYEKKFGDYKVILADNNLFVDGLIVEHLFRELQIQSYSACVDFLHYFGSQIPFLKINYPTFEYEQYDGLQKLIHDTCGAIYPDHGGRLKTIEFYTPEVFPINGNMEFGPFYTVRDVYISFVKPRNYGMVANEIHSDLLARSFPRLDMLFFQGLKRSQLVWPEQIPSLNTLCMTYNRRTACFPNEGLLMQNLQLKNFVFGCNAAFEAVKSLLQTIMKQMIALEELILIGCKFERHDLKKAVVFFRKCVSLKRFQFMVNSEDESEDESEEEIEEIREIFDDIIRKLKIRSFITTAAVTKTFSPTFLPEDHHTIIKYNYSNGIVATLTKIYPNNE